jgi:hypothetical protein
MYASESWQGIVAEPNYTIINKDNGHAHLVYCLEVPVYLHGNVSRKALKFVAAVEAAYSKRLDADEGYIGLIAKNPLHPDWKVLRGPDWAYELGELAAWIPKPELAKAKRSRRSAIQGLGRNCTLFESLRFWAYRNINRTAWVSPRAWERAVEDEALKINASFEPELAWPEVYATVNSVATWVWDVLRGSQKDYIARTHTSEVQAVRGKRGGEASGKARRRGTPLEHDREPWIAEGISRRTWFRRRAAEAQNAEGTLFDPGEAGVK